MNYTVDALVVSVDTAMDPFFGKDFFLRGGRAVNKGSIADVPFAEILMGRYENGRTVTCDEGRWVYWVADGNVTRFVDNTVMVEDVERRDQTS